MLSQRQIPFEGNLLLTRQSFCDSPAKVKTWIVWNETHYAALIWMMGLQHWADPMHSWYGPKRRRGILCDGPALPQHKIL